MTILQEVLLEEYERIQRTEALIEKEMEKLPKGYISKKKINGREYSYLQFRDGSKVCSQYIKASMLSDCVSRLELRKKDEAALAELRESKAAIIRALGKEFVDEYSAKGVSAVY